MHYFIIVQFQKICILPPQKVFCFAPPFPPGNSSLFSYISSQNLAFKTPLPLGISNDLPWGGYGFFLELHIWLLQHLQHGKIKTSKYLPRSMVKSSLGCANPGDADVELRISLNSTSSIRSGLGVMYESDDVLSLRGGETSPKSGKSCPNKRFRISSSSLFTMLSCENGEINHRKINFKRSGALLAFYADVLGLVVHVGTCDKTQWTSAQDVRAVQNSTKICHCVMEACYVVQKMWYTRVQCALNAGWDLWHGLQRCGMYWCLITAFGVCPHVILTAVCW